MEFIEMSLDQVRDFRQNAILTFLQEGGSDIDMIIDEVSQLEDFVFNKPFTNSGNFSLHALSRQSIGSKMIGITKEGNFIEINGQNLTGIALLGVIISDQKALKPNYSDIASHLSQEKPQCKISSRIDLLVQHIQGIKGAGVAYDNEVNSLGVDHDQLPKIIRQDFIEAIKKIIIL